MEKWEYRDPMEVAARRQRERQRREAACGKCEHRISMEVRGQPVEACGKRRRNYGVRCWMYEEKQ
jgi:uncharacterized protein YlaI